MRYGRVTMLKQSETGQQRAVQMRRRGNSAIRTPTCGRYLPPARPVQTRGIGRVGRGAPSSYNRGGDVRKWGPVEAQYADAGDALDKSEAVANAGPWSPDEAQDVTPNAGND